MSATLSLCLGYPIYFLLVYTQAYSDKICLLPTFFYVNYPSLIQNFRHLSAFLSCVLLWRGFWLLFDTYIATMSLAVKSPYLFYIICMFISYIILSLLKTASSINGPMSHMFDQYDLFPHYPNCYLVIWLNDIQNKLDSKKKTVSMEPYTNSLI